MQGDYTKTYRSQDTFPNLKISICDFIYKYIFSIVRSSFNHVIRQSIKN